MAKYRSIKIKRGSGGFGGPLIITPTEKKHKVLYVTAGEKPEIIDKIVELSGMEAVNGFKTSIPDEEIALAVIDCGGTLRCGIYPQKRIPTVNINPTGKSGPLAKYITEDIYVSAVGVDQIELADESEIVSETTEKNAAQIKKQYKYDTSRKITEQRAEKSFIARIGMGAGKIVATFNEAARNAVQTILTTVIPFMAFVSLIIGIIEGSGIGNWFANIMTPLAGNIVGLIIMLCLFSAGFVSIAGARSSYRSDHRDINRRGNRKGKHSPAACPAGFICH